MMNNEGQGKERRRELWFGFIQDLHPDINPKSIRLMDEVRQTSHALKRIGESSLAAAGLSYAKYRVLMSLLLSEELDGKTELNPSEISDRQGTTRNTISSLIRDLEEEGLIERQLDLRDRRRFNICLTEAGREKVLENTGEHFRAIAGCFDILNDSEIEALSQLMANIREQAYRKSLEMNDANSNS